MAEITYPLTADQIQIRDAIASGERCYVQGCTETPNMGHEHDKRDPFGTRTNVEPELPNRDLWHGLDSDTNPWLDSDTEVSEDEFFARRNAYEYVCGTTGRKPLMPGFTERDRDGLGWYDVPEHDRQLARIILDDIDAEHEDRHWFYEHPFCGACGDPKVAETLLARWMTLNPGRTPRDAWDGATLPQRPSTEAKGRSPFYTYDELGDLPEPEWLIDGLVPQGGIGYITGRDGSYKTFLAIDITVSTVAGMSQWHGERGLECGGRGRVLILEGEGVSSMRKRIDAAIEAKGITHEETELTGEVNVETGLLKQRLTGRTLPGLSPEQRASLVVRNGTVDLHGGNGDFHALLDFVRDFQPDVVIVDTLNRSAGGADQNSASDMSVITQRLHTIEQAAEERSEHGERCTVITVAHTDKGDNDARGSSAIEDDADFVLHCKKAEGRLKVTVAKMKDGESGFDFELLAQPFGASIALVDPPVGGEVVWTSSSARARVVGALRTLEPQGWASNAEITAVTAEDTFGQSSGPVNKGSVYREMNALLTEGAVEKHGSTKQYRLVQGWTETVSQA